MPVHRTAVLCAAWASCPQLPAPLPLLLCSRSLCPSALHCLLSFTPFACSVCLLELRLELLSLSRELLLGLTTGCCMGLRQVLGGGRGPLAHKQEEAGAMLGWVPTNRARSSIAFCGTSSLSLCPFPMIPSCCRRAGPKSRRRAVIAPFPRPPKVSTALWASLCLVQGLTAGEEPTLSSLCPSLERSYRWSTQPQHRNYFLGFRLSRAYV